MLIQDQDFGISGDVCWKMKPGSRVPAKILLNPEGNPSQNFFPSRDTLEHSYVIENRLINISPHSTAHFTGIGSSFTLNYRLQPKPSGLA